MPFYLADDFGEKDKWVGNMTLWAFLSLLFSGCLAVMVACTYVLLWTDYQLPTEPSLYPEVGAAPEAKAAPEESELPPPSQVPLGPKPKTLNQVEQLLSTDRLPATGLALCR